MTSMLTRTVMTTRVTMAMMMVKQMLMNTKKKNLLLDVANAAALPVVKLQKISLLASLAANVPSILRC
jgi:hypothetical protein